MCVAFVNYIIVLLNLIKRYYIKTFIEKKIKQWAILFYYIIYFRNI